MRQSVLRSSWLYLNRKRQTYCLFELKVTTLDIALSFTCPDIFRRSEGKYAEVLPYTAPVLSRGCSGNERTLQNSMACTVAGNFFFSSSARASLCTIKNPEVR